jgi:TonB family protein
MRIAARAACAAVVLATACARPSAPPARQQPAPMNAAPADTTRLYDISEVQVKPRLNNGQDVARMMERNYPPQLREAAINGLVFLSLVVERDGSTSTVQVTKTDDYRFAAPAAEAVRTMRWAPGTQGGVPVRVKAVLPVTYTARR